jgi:hypothetical protein
MTTNDPPQNEKNEGLLSFLTTVLKKSSELPQDVDMLSKAVSILAQQLAQVMKSLESIISAIDNQNKAISDLYTVQEFLLKKLRTDSADLESSLPTINKPKTEKPN